MPVKPPPPSTLAMMTALYLDLRPDAAERHSGQWRVILSDPACPEIAVEVIVPAAAADRTVSLGPAAEPVAPLTAAERRILAVLPADRDADAKEIAAAARYNRAYARRALASLVDRGMASRAGRLYRRLPPADSCH